MKISKDLLLASGIVLMTCYTGAQPVITRQPTNQSVSLGASANFRVAASSSAGPTRYQWRFNMNAIMDGTNALLTLTNISEAQAGSYDAVLTNNTGSVTSRVASLDVDSSFTKITTGALVTEKVTALRGYWGDYNNDGFVDVFLTTATDQQNRAQRCVLFRNEGDGTFAKVTNTVATSELRDWRFAAWADYDNDGDPDLYMTSTDANGVAAQNVLFRNRGDGTFEKMGVEFAGDLVPGGGGSEGCAWADYDLDGFLDIFVARYGPDWLFRNNGDGTFAKVQNTSVGLLLDDRDSYGPVWADYNGDGWPDLSVPVKDDTGRNQRNFLYRNEGGARFTQITSGAIATDNEYTMNCAWADYDNSGFLDFIAFNPGGALSLYRNNGDGTFTKETAATVGAIANDRAEFLMGGWGDYDNDGWLDIVVTTSSSGMFLYRNNGDGTFTRMRRGSIANDPGSYGTGASWADYDNDGFLDLLAARGGGHVPDVNSLYRNNGNTNAWIRLKLAGTLSNRSAIGAKVRVKATIGARSIWQLREVSGGVNANHIDPHFGLGGATKVDEIRIEWPSGAVQTRTNVAVNQILTIVEHQELPQSRPPKFDSGTDRINGFQLTVSGEPGLRYLVEASTNLADWARIAILTNANGLVEFNDSRSTKFQRRFYRLSAP